MAIERQFYRGSRPTPGLENEANLMDKDANPGARPEQRRPLPGIFRILFVVVFFLLVFLLGLSMVHHRFFRGQRVRSNGSLGQ